VRPLRRRLAQAAFRLARIVVIVKQSGVSKPRNVAGEVERDLRDSDVGVGLFGLRWAWCGVARGRVSRWHQSAFDVDRVCGRAEGM